MKKCILSLTILLFTCPFINAQYKINKTRYEASNYRHQKGDRYIPALAGIGSFVVPRLGQYISEELLRGAVFYQTACYSSNGTIPLGISLKARF